MGTRPAASGEGNGYSLRATRPSKARTAHELPGRNRLFAAVPALLLAGLVTADPVCAADLTQPIEFNIPAKSLAEALTDFSRRVDVILLAPTPLTAGKTSGALNGRMTARQALDALLEGTGLHYAVGEDGAIVIIGDQARSSTYQFEIAPQSLASALQAYSQFTGQAIDVNQKALRGIQSAGLTGSYTADEGLRQLLIGTGFEASTPGVGDIAIAIRAEGEVGQEGRASLLEEGSPSVGEADAGSVAAETESADIVVTGSRLRGAEPAGSQLITVDRSQIERSGYSEVSQVIRSLPQTAPLGASEATIRGPQSADLNITFGSSVNLRGLGPESTLTLLDGRRLAPGGYGTFVDISSIPLAVVERIEVLADGASAIYGSDAVGGVVNVILRDDFEGLEARLRYGFADGGRRSTEAGLVAGTGWAGGHITAAYEFALRGELEARKRDFYTSDLRPFGGRNFSSTMSNPGNVIVGGISYAIPPGQDGTDLQSGDLTPGTVNFQNLYEGAYVLPRQKRHSGFLDLRQDITDRIRLFAQALISQRKSLGKDRPALASLFVPSTNPFFVSPNPSDTSVQVDYSFIDDLGNVTYKGEATTYSLSGGGEADLAGSWRAQLYGTYSRQKDRLRSDNDVNFFYLSAALADSNPATAFNPFGGPAHNNAATIDLLRGRSEQESLFTVWSGNFLIDGPLISLPGGDVKAAAGIEYREEKLATQLQSLAFSASPSTPTGQKYGRQVKSIFGELNIPLIGQDNASAGLYRLTLSAAIRHEQYSDFGSTTNPKAGIDWSPMESVRLRTSYSKSFRSPRLIDLSASGDAGFMFPLIDPASASGTTLTLFRVGGNPNLQPEKATTWTAGLDIRPQLVDGLQFGVTYFDIDYRGRIDSAGGTNLFTVLANEEIYAPVITRNPSAVAVQEIYALPGFFGLPVDPTLIGALVDARPQNLARLRVRGLDVLASYKLSFASGALDLNANLSYLFDYRRQASATSRELERVNHINNPVDLRARTSATWSDKVFNVTAALNYVDSYSNDTVAPPERVDSWVTVDLNLAIDLGALQERSWPSGLTLSLSVENLFDEKPPFVNNLQGYGFDPQNASALGRFIALQAQAKW